MGSAQSYVHDQGHENFFGHDDAVQTRHEQPFFQTSMMIGKPNDKYEIEADSIADRVVQRPEISSIQRLSTPIEDENFSTNDQRIRNDRDIQQKPEVQARCSHCEQEEASSAVTSTIDSTRGKGESMPESTRYNMEAAFGTSFHDVNIHTDADSVGMNRELGAQAFTHGKDIYFNAGKYDPESRAGQHLLAHELTHVIQQSGGAYRDSKLQCDHDEKAHPNPAAKGVNLPIVPKLSANSGSFIDDGCGQVTWDVGWHLDHDSSDKGGWVIQHVTSYYNTFDCRGHYIAPQGKKSPISFFEAWRVEPNSTDMTPANIDTFKNTPQTEEYPHTAHTFGSYMTVGVAQYHDNVGENELPSHMVAHNPDTFAHSLRSSKRDPQVGGNVSEPVRHELSYHWACCGERGTKPTVIDSKKTS